MEYEQYCSHCGRELDSRKERLLIDSRQMYKILQCPKYHPIWGRKHRTITVGIEMDETILNYDPFTGERIKRVSTK